MDRKTFTHYGWIVVLIIILGILLAAVSPFMKHLTRSVKDMVYIVGDDGKFAFRLPAPKNLKIEKKILTFDPVDGATGYKITVANRDPIYVDAPSANIKDEVNAIGGLVQIKVQAMKGDDDGAPAKCTYDVPGYYRHGTNEILYSWEYLVENSCAEVYMDAYVGTACKFKRAPNGEDGDIRMPSDEGINALYMTDVASINGVTLCNSISQANVIDCIDIKSVTLGDGENTSPRYSFSGCARLTDIKFNDGITVLAGNMFKYCNSIQTVTVPETVKIVGSMCYYGCSNLTSVILPEGVERINASAFSRCGNLTEINLPDSITTIDSSAFEYCTKLESVVIPNQITSIPYTLFNGCTNLTTVTIPVSVTSISLGAFYDCTGMERIIYQGTMAQWQDISKDAAWKNGASDFVVVCTDGTVNS